LALSLLALNGVSFVLGFLCSNRSQRSLLYFFLFFFIGNAALLAIGRNHMGIDTVAGWRYQYGVLLVFAPMVAIVLDRLVGLIPFKYLVVIPQLSS
jgi:hypothetical protein